MPLLCWDEPKKVRSTEEHNREFSCEVADGAYVSNMSKEDCYKWKAKKIGGKDLRIEVRKTTEGKKVFKHGYHNSTIGQAAVLIVARSDGSILMSMNGKALFDTDELKQVLQEIKEAMV